MILISNFLYTLLCHVYLFKNSLMSEPQTNKTIATIKAITNSVINFEEKFNTFEIIGVCLFFFTLGRLYQILIFHHNFNKK